MKAVSLEDAMLAILAKNESATFNFLIKVFIFANPDLLLPGKLYVS